MKHFKKLAAAVLAVMMVLAMSLNALAEVSITVTGGEEGQEYSAYLIFAYETTTVNGNESYIYYLDKDNQFVDVVLAYAAQTGSGMTLVETTREVNSVTVDTYEVKVDDSVYSAADFAAYLKNVIDSAASGTYTAAATATATAGTGTIVKATLTDADGVEGYYFINTNLGSLTILDTTTGTLDVGEKNSTPSPSKDATEINGETSDDTVKIGDVVTYVITVTGGSGYQENNIVAVDTLSTGLTLDVSSIVVTDNIHTDTNGDPVEWVLDTDYTVSTTTNSAGETVLTVTLLSESNSGTMLKDLTTVSGKIYITYDATINENAAVYANTTTGITNSVYLEYTRDGVVTPTETVDETVDTYRFGIQKIGNGSQLAGAVFNVKKVTDDGNGTVTYSDPLNFISYTGAETEYSYYRLATAEEIADTSITTITDLTTTSTHTIMWLEGLDAGTYVIEEIDAPAGYNLLNGTITLVISEDGTRTFTYNGSDDMLNTTTNNTYKQSDGSIVNAYITINNSTGSLLPSTGGMGTRIFYTLGGILVIGAGILLITKRRMNSAK